MHTHTHTLRLAMGMHLSCSGKELPFCPSICHPCLRTTMQLLLALLTLLSNSDLGETFQLLCSVITTSVRQSH